MSDFEVAVLWNKICIKLIQVMKDFESDSNQCWVLL